MNQTIFGKRFFVRALFLLAFIPMFYLACGKTGVLPTSATNGVLTSAVVANTTLSTITAAAGGAWVNNAFPVQTSDFTVTFDAVVSAAPTNAILALSNGAQTAYASFADLVRFNPTGDLDAYNGSIPNYAGPSTAIPYQAGTAYHFTLLVHMTAQTYDISVGSQVIGTGFKFRTAASSLNNVGAFVSTTGGSGTLTVSNFTVAPVVVATATPTATRTTTLTSTVTNTPTASYTRTSTATFTVTRTPTSTLTKTSTPTVTFTRTATATPTKTSTPKPPTATPTPVPAKGIDFSQWFLQLPIGSGTSPTVISSSTLVKGYSSAYFYIASDGEQAYMDPKTGITTSGSQHPRCEMHENGTWSASGTNTLTVNGKVTLINGDTTCVGQIFNNDDSITLVELQYSKSLGGFKVFYEEAKGAGSYPTQTTIKVPMNTAYSYQLSLTGKVAKVTINGQVAFTKSVSSAVNGNQFYFKAGNYDQSATAGAISTSAESVVEIGSAIISHK